MGPRPSRTSSARSKGEGTRGRGPGAANVMLPAGAGNGLLFVLERGLLFVPTCQGLLASPSSFSGHLAVCAVLPLLAVYVGARRPLFQQERARGRPGHAAGIHAARCEIEAAVGRVREGMRA